MQRRDLLKAGLAATAGAFGAVSNSLPALQTDADQASVPSPAFVETPAQHAARIAWWRQARFGLFIHWGIYAVPGRGEWVQWQEQIPIEEYAKFAEQFKPTHFDADAWAATAKAAGMKYTVFTARHHDGFAMFDDPGNDFTSVNTAAQRDFVADYVKAMRKAGLRVGLYYSPLDWRFPGFFMPDLQRKSAEAMRAQYHRQMRELLSNYGPLDLLWFDGGQQDWLNFRGQWIDAEWHQRPRSEHYQGHFSWGNDEVYAMIRRLQPQVLVNDRADMPEDFHSREGLPNNHSYGDFDAQHPWEFCSTINGAWGWRPDKPPESLRTLIQLLVNVAGRDGNLLLNVGPRPDGQIDPPQVARLREIGQWLDQYGESIYATRGGPFLPGDWGASTHAGQTIYVHVLQWPQGTLSLPAIPSKIVHASALTGGDVSFTQTDRGIEIALPASSRQAIDTIVKLQLAQSVADIQPVGHGSSK